MKTLNQLFIYITFILTLIAFPASSSEEYADIKTPKELGLPALLWEGLDETDKKTEVLQSSWFDSGSGPGQLEWQDQYYQSQLLSTAFASGYMTSINYSWSGTFNGWNNVEVYLAIVAPDGQVVGSADVTNSSSGTLSVPSQEYPASYSIGFVYIVNQQPRVMIYQGPFFGGVSVTVLYQ
ncbi:hypothetical protein [Aliidiomarina maris]|uniref:Uncharacterized protein n=1 Tax=Aliidiomarina maris TaxID=531312 RepID=A0A327WYZ0_9GAMM|nr:hypothetical protein [Aliidiomarina maris]RAJ98815.1 hypothetical protein B0I24_10416 [Aliidiomarina maris]RUO24963.1 hypothetical protein CWE07_05650 [Aliidiomarina maris]